MISVRCETDVDLPHHVEGGQRDDPVSMMSVR